MINFEHYAATEDQIEFSGGDTLIAGEWTSLVMDITFAEPELGEGDAFVVGVPFGFSVPQLDDPQGEGFASYDYEGNADVEAVLYPKKARYLRFEVRSGKVRQGEKLVVTFGDRSKGAPGLRVSPQVFERAHFECFRETQEATQVASFPAPRVKNAACKHLRSYVTPSFKSGESLTLTIIAEDEYGNRCTDYSGEVAIDNPEVGRDLPQRIELCEKDQGVKNVNFAPSDLSHFRLSMRDHAESFVSNASVRLPNDFPYRLYFGEIHAHTEMSMDGWGTPEKAYEFARDTAALDFAATADHAILVTGEPKSGHPFQSPLFKTVDNPERWRRTCEAARSFNEPHRFVTFPGVELSPTQTDEDINLYFLEDYPEMLDPNVTDKNARNETWEGLEHYMENHQVMAIPHHPAIAWRIWNRYPEDLHDFFRLDKSKMPLIEMFSKHGNSDHFGSPKPLLGTKKGRTLHDIFAAGYRFGVIGGSDTHFGNPGSRMTEPGPYITLQYQNGLAAVWAPELTRQGLWDSMFARRTYATTGRKTVLFFDVDGLFMGEEGVRAPGERQIRLKAWGEDRIVKAEILKNNEFLAGDAGKQPCQYLNIDTVDETDSEQQLDFYQARITESGGEIAWTTPVWIRRA